MTEQLDSHGATKSQPWIAYVKVREKCLPYLSHHFCVGKPDPDTQYHDPSLLLLLSPSLTNNDAPTVWRAETGHRSIRGNLARLRM